MDLLKSKILGLCLLLGLCGCQIPYLIKSGYNQVSLLTSRVDIDKVLADPELNDNDRKKLLLARKVKRFASETLHLSENKSYTTFVKLDRPSLSYVVNASEKWQLKSYIWYFPIVGHVPYKGFFNEADAKVEEQELKAQGLDTYVRGVSAFSSLGWFNDPIYSSMTAAKDYDFVDTLIHETVHATLYIKNSADFNERMAVFLGTKGAELFYLQEEGEASPTLLQIRQENADEKLFSQFIGKEIRALEQWYKTTSEKSEEIRLQRLEEINTRFKLEVEPKLQGGSYQRFASAKLNNARLSLYRTYLQDLSDFEELYELSQKNFSTFLDYCRTLERHEKPELGLKELIGKLKTSSPTT